MLLLAACAVAWASGMPLPQEGGEPPVPPQAQAVAPLDALAEAGGCALDQLEQRMVRLYRELRPSLVGVRMTLVIEGLDEPQHRTSSGVVLDDYGLVVAPVALPRGVAFEVHDIQVTRMDERQFAAEVVEHSRLYNLSLLRAKEMRGLAPRLGRGLMMEEGAITIAMGNSYNLPGNVSLGFLSGTNRRIASAWHLMQVTNPINPGDRGGILANRAGEVVGIQLTSLAGAAEGLLNGDWGEIDVASPEAKELLRLQKEAVGVSFCVPVEIVVEQFPEHLGALLPDRRMLGVEVSPTLEETVDPDGSPGRLLCLMVHGVAEGSVAGRAGVQAGDVLLEVGGRKVSSLSGLGCAIRAAPDSGFTLRVRRGDHELELAASFAPPPTGG